MKIRKKDVLFVIGVSVVYCSLSASFSLVSTILPDKTVLINPIEYGSLNLKEIIGHFGWGVVAALVSLRVRYILLGGLLAVLIDSDHLVGLLHVEGIPRMSHSITFAIISTIILMLVFCRKDYRLGAIVATSVLTHISFDILSTEVGFPIFTPFVNKTIVFPNTDWIILEIIATIIIGIVSFLATQKESAGKQIPREPAG